MSRFIWSAGVSVLMLALLGAAWLRRPVEPSTLAVLAPVEPPPPSSPPRGDPPPVPPSSTGDEQALAEPPRARPAAAPPPDTQALPATPPVPARARRKPAEPRVRVVTALRAEHPTPDARREAVLAELAGSGESDAPWTRDARAALDTWRARVEADVLPVRAEPPRCFAAGCVARVTFPDAASFDESFQRTAELRLGVGSAHLQLPPERLPSGEVVAAWVVLPPDAP